MPTHVSASELRRLLGPSRFRGPAYQDLATRIRLLIIDGQLSGGARLPSERELGLTLGLSRTTVAAGYAQLRDGGLITARRGAGNFVERVAAPPVSAVLPMPGPNDGRGTIALNAACGAAPPGIAAAYQRAAATLPELLAGTGYYPDGLPRLRSRLADWFTARGVPTDPGQIVITSGALAAVNVVARALLGPRDVALVESPTYYNVITVLAAVRARMIGVPISADRWPVAAFTDLLARHRPRLAFLITEFQNPTGAWPTDAEREQICAALRHSGTVGVVDETLLELSLDGDPPRRPMAAFGGSVITIGSASKAFWGGLRLGWIRAPRSMINSLVAAQASFDLGAPPLEQVVLAELLDDQETIVGRQNEAHRARRDHLLSELAGRLPSWRIRVPRGGMSLWCELDEPVSELVVASARDHGLILTAGPRFYPPGLAAIREGARRVRIPFVAETEVLSEAVRRLGAAWDDVIGGAARTPAETADELVI